MIRGGGGNPFLRPYRANAVDLNIEQYFGRGGVIALQLFYKDIKSYVFPGRFLFDYSGFPLPTGAAGFPNLPTIAEAGLPGYDVRLWIGLTAPAGTRQGEAEQGEGLVFDVRGGR